MKSARLAGSLSGKHKFSYSTGTLPGLQAWCKDNGSIKRSSVSQAPAWETAQTGSLITIENMIIHGLITVPYS
jgi:hypothetical protein